MWTTLNTAFMQKLNLHPSHLSWDITLKILPSDWSKVFRPIYREPELCQIWGLWGNTSNNMIFHFRIFQGKTDVNIFLKLQKGPVFWPIFGPFLANQNYSEKSVLDQFFPVLGRYYCAKFQKTDRRILRKAGYRHKNELTDKHEFTGPFWQVPDPKWAPPIKSQLKERAVFTWSYHSFGCI